MIPASQETRRETTLIAVACRLTRPEAGAENHQAACQERKTAAQHAGINLRHPRRRSRGSRHHGSILDSENRAGENEHTANQRQAENTRM